MQEPIKAVYSETIDHLIKASEEIPRKHSKLFLVLMFTMGPLIFGFQEYQQPQHRPYWYIWFFGGCLFYFGLVWLLYFSRFIRRWQLRRYYARSHRKEPLAVEWSFSDADIIQRAGMESTSRLAWTHFKRAIRKPNGFLLETPNKTYHWIPRASLASNENFEALAELLKQKISPYEVVEK
jgi:hypothetical protein